MKQAYRFCLCILIVFGIACSVALAQEEWMPDPNLRRLVREKLGIPNGIPLTQLQMQRLYGLVSIDDGIESLQGLEHAVNMDFLHLSGGSVSDLAPLMWLENLRALKLYSQNISDISALLNLVTLENLELHDNNISDIRPLSNLVNLKRLQLHDNQIVDFTPLLELQIDVLSIRNNPGTGTAAVILNTADSQICDVHQTDHIFSRVQNREYPSILGRGITLSICRQLHGIQGWHIMTCISAARCLASIF
jgi:Leucine-rich repeat (LRR) protein